MVLYIQLLRAHVCLLRYFLFLSNNFLEKECVGLCRCLNFMRSCESEKLDVRLEKEGNSHIKKRERS